MAGDGDRDLEDFRLGDRFGDLDLVLLFGDLDLDLLDLLREFLSPLKSSLT